MPDSREGCQARGIQDGTVFPTCPRAGLDSVPPSSLPLWPLEVFLAPKSPMLLLLERPGIKILGSGHPTLAPL